MQAQDGRCGKDGRQHTLRELRARKEGGNRIVRKRVRIRNQTKTSIRYSTCTFEPLQRL